MLSSSLIVPYNPKRSQMVKDRMAEIAIENQRLLKSLLAPNTKPINTNNSNASNSGRNKGPAHHHVPGSVYATALTFAVVPPQPQNNAAPAAVSKQTKLKKISNPGITPLQQREIELANKRMQQKLLFISKTSSKSQYSKQVLDREWKQKAEIAGRISNFPKLNHLKKAVAALTVAAASAAEGDYSLASSSAAPVAKTKSAINSPPTKKGNADDRRVSVTSNNSNKSWK